MFDSERALVRLLPCEGNGAESRPVSRFVFLGWGSAKLVLLSAAVRSYYKGKQRGTGNPATHSDKIRRKESRGRPGPKH